MTMEDLKSKFRELLDKQKNTKIPSITIRPDLYFSFNESQKHDELPSKAEKSSDNDNDTGIPDEEILESITEIYFKLDSDFDSVKYELERLPRILNSRVIEEHYKKLKQQHQVVSKKVLQLILQKQKDYKEGLQRILSVQEQLQNMLTTCRLGRVDLSLVKKQYTTANLGIYANYRKKQIIADLLSNLNSIKTLQRTEYHLQEFINEENYPEAIALILECQNAAQTFKQFNCIAALSGKLQDTLDQVEEILDNKLAKICTNFDIRIYSSVQEAYQLLEKSQTAIDQLHMHFTATIHNTALASVHSFTGGDMKRQYKQLCRLESQENFIPCLTELCKSMWAILTSYYLIIKWHNTTERDSERFIRDKCNLEDDYTRQHIKHKLETGVVRIWHDVEMKISTFMEANPLDFKFEQFVQVLGIINRMIKVGEELCASKSDDLQECIKVQCLSYLSIYHSLRLDELRIFLENDGWEICPVKPNFSATQLQEFKSLKPNSHISRNLDDSECLDLSDNENSLTGGYIQRFLDEGISPFDINFDDSIDEDILVKTGDESLEYDSEESEDEINEELHKEFIHEIEHSKRKSKRKHSGPIVTNTTLSILRVCGKYLQMTKLLKSIDVPVIENMIQFFELYFYTVYIFFTSDLLITSDSLYSPKLKRALIRLKENLIMNDTDVENTSHRGHKIQQPLMSPMVNLTQVEKLFGFTERAVAAESLIFLGEQYEHFKDYFSHLIVSNSGRDRLNLFYTQTITSVKDLRKPVYMAVVSQALDINGVLNLMNKVNWEVRDVMSQHNYYIDKILQDMETLHVRLDEIGNRISLPEEAYSAVWENVSHLVTRTLVEGFSNAKKCSNGGRGLMQLDFTQLASKFESLTCLRPMPHKEYVELYIKAFYLTEGKLEEWIKEHKEYSTKQLIGLVSCTCQNNKKTRQRLISLIEDPSFHR